LSHHGNISDPPPDSSLSYRATRSAPTSFLCGWAVGPDSLRNPVIGRNSFRQFLKTFLFAFSALEVSRRCAIHIDFLVTFTYLQRRLMFCFKLVYVCRRRGIKRSTMILPPMTAEKRDSITVLKNSLHGSRNGFLACLPREKSLFDARWRLAACSADQTLRAGFLVGFRPTQWQTWP